MSDGHSENDAMASAEPILIRPPWRDVALWLLAGLAVYLTLFPWFYAGKRLSHDDLALYVSARDEGPRYWFTTGYSQFFDGDLYPFIRPVSHALMRFDQLLFGSHYALFFIPFFLMLGVGAWAGTRIAAALGLPRRLQLAIGVVMLLQPAWLPQGLLYITFQQDALAGVLCTLAALACINRRWILAAICLALAIFTKEIALFAPIAIAAWALVWLRSWRGAALTIAPLVAWAILRTTVVGSIAGDTYATQGGAGGLAHLARGIALWPTGFVTATELKALLFTILRSGPMALAKQPLVAVQLALNALLDLMIAIAALAAALRLVRREAPGGPELAAEALILVWVLGAFGLVALVAYEIRFAAALHPALLLLLARLAYAPPFRSRLLRPAALAALALFVIGMAIATCSWIAQKQAEPEPAAFAALTRAVAATPAGADERILVIHAPVTGPKPSWQMAFMGHAGTMYDLNRAHGCIAAPGVPAPLVEPLADGRVRVTASVPDCAVILELWSTDKPGLAENGARRELAGGSAIDYAFPQGRVARGFGGRVLDYNFGRVIVAQFDPGDFSRVLIRDWNTGGYLPLTIPTR